MSRNKVKKNLTHFEKSLTPGSSFLTVFFYLSQNKLQNPESLIQFFHEHQMKVWRAQDTTFANSLQNFVKNANFVAQSDQFISKTEFETWLPFLTSHFIVVAFLYQNQIWDGGRCHKDNKNLLGVSSNRNSKFFFSNPLPFLRNTFKQVGF